MKKLRTIISSPIFLASVLAVLIFSIDLRLHLGVSVGVAYIAVIWVASKSDRARQFWRVTIGCVVLTIVGALLSPDGSLHPFGIIMNRILAIAAIIMCAKMLLNLSRTRRLEAYMTSIVESANDAIAAMDVNGRITVWNDGAEKMFGFSAAEILGQPMKNVFPSVNYKDNKLLDMFRRDGQVVGVETNMFKKSGEEMRVTATIKKIENSQGKSIGVSTLTRDISEYSVMLERQEALNSELQHSNEALMQSNMELQQFAYIASHDLQSPLRRIASFLQLLQGDYHDKLDEQANDWIDRTVAGVENMQDLITDLLSFSRVESKSSVHSEVDLNKVTDEVIAMHLVPDADGVESKAKITRGELPKVVADSSQLTQLLDNLVGNALKYNVSDQPEVRIDAETLETHTVLSVSDNGIGIKAEHHDKIFEIFRRLHTPQEYAGSGIGLAICRRILSKHGGKMWLDSELGEGSTFHFTIPNRKLEDENTSQSKEAQ